MTSGSACPPSSRWRPISSRGWAFGGGGWRGSPSRATGGTYHPASDASELNGIASSINLRLTVTHEPLPLAGAFIALALALLATGAVLTVARTGRVI